MKRYAKIIGLVVGILAFLYIVMLPKSCYVLSAVVQSSLAWASHETYSFQYEGDTSGSPSADDALKYARLALAERVSNPESYKNVGEPRMGAGTWLVEFIDRSDEDTSRWKAWNVWVEFKESEVVVRVVYHI